LYLPSADVETKKNGGENMNTLLKEEKVGVIGFGELGSSLFEGWSAAGRKILVNNGSLERTREKLAQSGTDIEIGRSIKQLTEECQVIALAIRGVALHDVTTELDHHAGQNHIVLSFMAQESRESVLGLLRQAEAEVCKGMTTLGVRKQKGVSAVQFGESASYAVTNRVMKLLGDLGSVSELDSEKEMQAFTVTVGCFPGALAYMLEQWEFAGKQNGVDLSSNFSTLLRSSADLLEKHGGAQALRCAVATKGGVTQAIVETMGKRGLSSVILDGINAGKERMQKRA
jgi:pyrroline-5-carboxylate reductase